MSFTHSDVRRARRMALLTTCLVTAVFVAACSLEPGQDGEAVSAISFDIRGAALQSLNVDSGELTVAVLPADRFEEALDSEEEDDPAAPEIGEDEFEELMDAGEAAFLHEELGEGEHSGSETLELVPGEYHAHLAAAIDDRDEEIRAFGGSYFDWEDIVSQQLDPEEVQAALTEDLLPPVELVPGGTVNLPLELRSLAAILALGIAVPDYGNNRIVVMEDMEGSGRHVVDEDNAGDILDGSDLAPKDVAYDDGGRLWVANEYDGAFESPVLMALDDTENVSGEAFPGLGGVGVSAIAVDDERGGLYFWRNDDADDWSLRFVSFEDVENDDIGDAEVILDNGDLLQPEFGEPTEMFVSGLEVDAEGEVVAAVNGIHGLPELRPHLMVFDPTETGPDAIDEYLGPDDLNLSQRDDLFGDLEDVVRDVTVTADGEIFTTWAVFDGFEVEPIGEVDRVGSDFTAASVEAVQPDSDFFGPQRFVAKRQRATRAIVTDWDGVDPDSAFLIAFSDADGSDWQMYADLDDPFEFFELADTY